MVEDLWRKQQYKHDTRFVDNYISQYRRYSDIQKENKENKETYSVNVKHNFHYLPSNKNTLCM